MSVAGGPGRGAFTDFINQWATSVRQVYAVQDGGRVTETEDIYINENIMKNESTKGNQNVYVILTTIDDGEKPWR